MIACALSAKNNIIIKKVDPKIVKSEIDVLKKVGIKIIKKNHQLLLKNQKIKQNKYYNKTISRFSN